MGEINVQLQLLNFFHPFTETVPMLALARFKLIQCGSTHGHYFISSHGGWLHGCLSNCVYGDGTVSRSFEHQKYEENTIHCCIQATTVPSNSICSASRSTVAALCLSQEGGGVSASSRHHRFFVKSESGSCP